MKACRAFAPALYPDSWQSFSTILIIHTGSPLLPAVRIVEQRSRNLTHHNCAACWSNAAHKL